jgi:predicted nucleic acid-binding protein
MPPTRIYLDACCLNRPFDDQRAPRVRIESEAVREILDRVESGSLEWIVSDILVHEIGRNPHAERRGRVLALLRLANEHISVGGLLRAEAEALVALGFDPNDALHYSAAHRAGCEVFLTTDDALQSKIRRLAAANRMRVENPASWVLSWGRHE